MDVLSSFKRTIIMDQISIFDMLKVGIGPSSSHTLGPWRAAQQWLHSIANKISVIDRVQIRLYGSLSLTGKGHATDMAVILGLAGEDPVAIHTASIRSKLLSVSRDKELFLNGKKRIDFDPNSDICFEMDFLPFHPNGIEFKAYSAGGCIQKSVYYSIGGGFICQEENDCEISNLSTTKFPFPIANAEELCLHCREQGAKISEIVYRNELAHYSEVDISEKLNVLWQTMLQSMYDGCHTQGTLPGVLKVKRRAFDIHQRLMKEGGYSNVANWMETIRLQHVGFDAVSRWISCFALSVNEVNAAMGKIVTAPTNGSAGVIPAVLMYFLCFVDPNAGRNEIERFLLVAGEMGSIFKKGATISAALGGCQAEIGVSSAMAAAALTELLDGSVEQCMVAAEIAMEHHLGMTCDPIAGLVQVPCIERNSMGAIKAIHAAHLALETDPKHTLVPLDKVIATMWETAQNMNRKYKETSEGGLAVAVNLADC